MTTDQVRHFAGFDTARDPYAARNALASPAACRFSPPAPRQRATAHWSCRFDRLLVRRSGTVSPIYGGRRSDADQRAVLTDTATVTWGFCDGGAGQGSMRPVQRGHVAPAGRLTVLFPASCNECGSGRFHVYFLYAVCRALLYLGWYRFTMTDAAGSSS